MTEDLPPVRTRPLWWWSLWLLLGLAIGLQALRMRAAQSAVDAESGARATMLRPQNGWGQAFLAQEQLASGKVDAAIASSRRALSLTPLAVVAVRTLAGALDSKAPAGGEHAWQIASTMGWRDQQTQMWALLRALSNGQSDIFVMRADALMRTKPDDAKMTSVVRQALTEPEIRKAFLTRIELDPEWRTRLFTADHPLAGRELQGTLLALRGLAQTRTPPQPGELRDTIAGLIAEGRFDAAIALDQQFVRRTPDNGSLIADGGFDGHEDYRTDVTPFDWTFVRGARVDQSGGRKSLLLSRDDKAPLVRRFVALPAGRYRLSYATKGATDSPQSLGVTIRCAGIRDFLATSSRQPLAGDGWENRAVDFAVPAGCPLVIVELTAFKNGEQVEAQFDDIRIVPAR